MFGFQKLRALRDRYFTTTRLVITLILVLLAVFTFVISYTTWME